MDRTIADANPNTNDSLDTSEAINLLLNKENTPTQASEDIQEPQEDTEVVSVEEVDATEETEAEEGQSEVTEEETENYLNSEESDEEANDDVYIAKVDGEEVEVSARELIESFQLNSVAKKRFNEATVKEKEAKATLDNLEAERKHYNQQLEVLKQQISQSANTMTEQQWNDLYQRDPTAYLKAKQDQIDQERQLQAVQSEQNALLQKHLQSEQEKLLERIPKWKDPEVAQKERNNIVTFAKRFGFNDTEIANTNDSRVVDLLRRAYLYDVLQSKKPAVTKKVNKAPKMVKAGKPKGKVNVSEQNRKTAFEKLAKSGRREDAISYLLTK